MEVEGYSVSEVINLASLDVDLLVVVDFCGADGKMSTRASGTILTYTREAGCSVSFLLPSVYFPSSTITDLLKGLIPARLNDVM